MTEFITATVDGNHYICAPCSVSGDCQGCIALDGVSDDLCKKLVARHLDDFGDGVCQREDVVWVIDVRKQEVEQLHEENKELRDTISSIDEKEKRRSKPNKSDIKRLRALVARMERREKDYQNTSGDPWPRSVRATEKQDCAALSRILKLLEKFQGA